MADSNPISPPPLSANSQPSASDEPISPVNRSGSFPHKTSASVSTRTPFIDTSTPSINTAPVELDGVPTSPDELKRRDTGRERKGSIISPGLGEEDEIEAEFLGEGEKGVSSEVREKRAAMLASRSKDPGVIVDLPKDPTAEEVEAAKSAEGAVTPGLPPPGVEPGPTKR